MTKDTVSKLGGGIDILSTMQPSQVRLLPFKTSILTSERPC